MMVSEHSYKAGASVKFISVLWKEAMVISALGRLVSTISVRYFAVILVRTCDTFVSLFS